ncbi:uncharacterized protein LOC115736386 [Rhodamnia argentea]|uniref:Uncharacterized protein LOC115736386 n=1 Tax=Rhodamnia argentea TaxID=178133 RepID=A0A8B8NP69_9MYRT|nr:uncharacterized protein LOC115736386 [Rhodamnia argentea]
MQHAKVGAVPPPPPPLPNFRARRAVAETSVTNREIARFWRQKRIEEEDHLLAAIKAAARVRARKLSEDDYKRFVESLDDVNGNAKENNAAVAASHMMWSHAKEEKEVRIGIKDWWTKSKYAYLNQPALKSMDHPRRTSSYTPNCFSYKPVPLYPTSLGVF